MKKYIYIALAAAAFASCSQDEALVLNQEEIQFGDAFVNNATRAIDPSYGTDAVELAQFNVWGAVQGTSDGTQTWVPIFANDKVVGTVGSTNGTANIWNCTKTQYWIAGAPYQFAAVVNGGVDNNKFTLVNGLPTAVQFSSEDGQTDLLYASATATGAAQGNAPVNFDFSHMLAKAVFTVSNTTNTGNSNNSGYYYKVSDVKILNPVLSSTCTFDSDANTSGLQTTWSVVTPNTDAANAYLLGNVTNADKKATTGLTTEAIEISDRASKLTSHRECMLIPYNYETGNELQVQYTIELYMENGENDVLVNKETGKVAKAVVNIQPGYSYSFNLSVSLSTPIQFSVTSNPTWVVPANGNISL